MIYVSYLNFHTDPDDYTNDLRHKTDQCTHQHKKPESLQFRKLAGHEKYYNSVRGRSGDLHRKIGDFVGQIKRSQLVPSVEVFSRYYRQFRWNWKQEWHNFVRILKSLRENRRITNAIVPFGMRNVRTCNDCCAESAVHEKHQIEK